MKDHSSLKRIRQYIMVVLVPMLLWHGALAADRPWQQITQPAFADVAARFQTPPSQYGLTQWWGWDGPMSEAVITRDLDAFKSRGVNIVTIEAGYGMPAPYLSSGWFELVRIAVEQAKQRGMHVWLVDEGKYPSGFAGGKFSAERPDLRMQALVVAEHIAAAAGETIARKLPPETVGAIAVDLADNICQVLDVSPGELHWTVPATGTWQVLIVEHQFRTSDTRAANNPTRGKDTNNSLCDYLDPAATRQFLEFTHEQYKRYVGAEFGQTVLGFRGDEPDYSINGVPWTPAIVDVFRQRKGYDVRPYLASFFAPRLTQEQKRAKADYWDVWSDLFRDNFFRVQADWCAANNMEYLVHLNHEDELMKLVRSEGDFFKDMRYVQLPGIDTIWNQIWPGKISDFPKLASSAAHLFGRPRAFTESFAGYNPRPTVEQAGWVINQQFVRGINMIEIMFQPSSATPRRGPSGWLASDQFPAVVGYVNRASYLLALGRPTAQIALYLPTTSMWLGDEEANKSTLSIMQQLLERQRDFDFVDEQSLSSILKLDGGGLKNLSGQSYRAVIVPAASTLSKAALDRLRAFAAAGGRVIFMGRGPSIIVEKNFLHAAGPANLDWAMHEEWAGQLTPRVLNALPQPDVMLDGPCPAVKYLHRRWRDADLYFFFNESNEKQSRQAVLRGSGRAQVWDAASGRVETLPGAKTEKGTLRLPLTLAPYETKFIVIGPLPSPKSAD